MPTTSPSVVRRPPTLDAHRDVVKEARKIIDDRLRDPTLRVRDVAFLLSVSERTLQRAFETCGSDFSRELFEARMHAAVRSLGRGMRVNWTARWSGFRSPSHFTKAFGDRFQITPSQFGAACKLQQRLVNRRFKDGVDPVTTGSPEYHRRRKRYTEDVRALRHRVVGMSPAAKAALLSVDPSERRVFTLEELAEMRARRSRRFHHYTDEQFERAYELHLARLESGWAEGPRPMTVAEMAREWFDLLDVE